MSLLLLSLICLFVGLPIGIALILRTVLMRQTEDRTLSLHKQHLEDLTHDHKIGLLGTESYKAARLETERHIIDHISTPPQSLLKASRAHWIIAISSLLLIPLLAVLLYAMQGEPLLGPHPSASLPHFNTPAYIPPSSPTDSPS